MLMRQVATRGAEVQQLKITLDNERMEVESLRREVRKISQKKNGRNHRFLQVERLNQRLQGLESVLAVERQTVCRTIFRTSALILILTQVFQHEARRDRTTTENRQLHEQIIQLETERYERTVAPVYFFVRNFVSQAREPSRVECSSRGDQKGVSLARRSQSRVLRDEAQRLRCEWTKRIVGSASGRLPSGSLDRKSVV